jgi:hypothetical protein
VGWKRNWPGSVELSVHLQQDAQARILPIAICGPLAIDQAMRLIIVSAVFVALGVVIAIRKPKPGKESLDWLGGFIAGGAMIALFASLTEYFTRR